MWKDFLYTFLEKLKDPNVSSSFLPLVVVITIFLLFSLVMLSRFVLRARLPKAPQKLEGGDSKTDSSTFIILNRRAQFRNFLKRILVGDESERERHVLAELDQLRGQIEHLEKDNAKVREMHARAVHHVTELKGEISLLEKTKLEDKRKIATAEERRLKIQQKADRIESQLLEVLGEIERIHRENAEVIEFQQISGKLGDMLKGFHSDGAGSGESTKKSHAKAQDVNSAKVAEKDAEIKKLKELLIICKQQILGLTKTKNAQANLGKSG